MSEALYADGFEDAIIGIGYQFNTAVVVYDLEKCIKIIMEKDGIDYDRALEDFNFNVVGAYLGNHTPVFVRVGKNTEEDI